MKSARQTKIMELIQKFDIETQNQLLEYLEREGVKSTQATLSRDIRDLHLVKELGPTGVYHYVRGIKDNYTDYDARLRKILRESVVSYDKAQNLLVIKTLPGLASAVCSALDGMKIHGLVGSIAGDDTAFLAMRDVEAAEDFLKEIGKLL